MSMKMDASLWSVPVTVENIPDNGLHMKLEAPVAVLAGLAALAGVRKLQNLSADFELTRRGAKVQITGQVTARVGQNCVVTLEPIERDVSEAVDVTFAPVRAEGAPTGEVEVKLDQEPPEPLVEGKVDLGALAAEFLVLGIDLYPRKADAEFIPLKVDDPESHPFAALAALKKPRGGG
jgi:uncharacterized metal-binding protein YceD (DUF177 family)